MLLYSNIILHLFWLNIAPARDGMMADEARRNAWGMWVDAGLDQAATDGLLDLRRVGDERLAFHAVGAAAVERVAGFLGVILSEEAFVFVVGEMVGHYRLLKATRTDVRSIA